MASICLGLNVLMSVKKEHAWPVSLIKLQVEGVHTWLTIGLKVSCKKAIPTTYNKRLEPRLLIQIN